MPFVSMLLARRPLSFLSASFLPRGACGSDSEWLTRQKRLRHSSIKVLPPDVLPVDHYNSPFHELDLEELWKGLGKTRVRQHVNPLRIEHQVPVTVPKDWSRAFSDPTLPLVIDLGCGPGRFLMLLHKRRLESSQAAAPPPGDQLPSPIGPFPCNFLGVEIREQLVDRANEWTSRLGYQGRVHYVYCNATISLASLMASYPGKVNSILIQFPDPHFKKRHYKRRILQPGLVQAICDLLPPGGQLFLQSDVETASIAMRNILELYAFDKFEPAPQHSGRDEDVFFSNSGPSSSSDGAAPASSSNGAVGSSSSSNWATHSSFSSDEAAAAWQHSEDQAQGRTLKDGHSDFPLTTDGPGALQDGRPDSPGGLGGLQDGHPDSPGGLGGLQDGHPDSPGGPGALKDGHPDSPGGPGALQDGHPDSPGGLGGLQDCCLDSPGGLGGLQDESELDSETDEPMSDSSDAASQAVGSSRGFAAFEVDYGSMQSSWASAGWLRRNPIGIPTEREHYVLQQGLPVFRVLLVRR